jgi:hypothetical protein
VLIFGLVFSAFPAVVSAAPVSQIDWRNVPATEVDAVLTPDISIVLDGRKLDLLNDRGDEVAVLNYNGAVYLPIRAVSYAFGAMIRWAAWEQKLTGMNMREVMIWTGWDKDAYGDVIVPQKRSEITDKTPQYVKAVSDFAIFVTLDYTLTSLRDTNGNRVAPIVYSGTTYLPIRAVGQIFGCGVTWDSATRTVILTSGGQPLFGSNPYVPLRVPQRAEKNAFLENTPDNATRNQKFIDWLYANTDVLVSYISSYYGGASYQPIYGNNGPRNEAYYETDTIKSYFLKMVGSSDRETAANVISGVQDMTIYGSPEYYDVISNLSGTQPYSVTCYESGELVVAALKSIGIPAFRINGVPLWGPRPNDGHVWAACYIPDEGVWEFIDAAPSASDTPKRKAPFLDRQKLDELYETEDLVIPGGAVFSLDDTCPLATSYYLHQVYPDRVVPVS